MGTQENLISDHHEGNNEGRWERRDDQQGTSDSFVVDIETLSHGATDHHQKDKTTTNTANSRTMTSFQRNLSRKVSSQQRGKSTANTPQKDSSSTVSLSLGAGGHVLDDSSKAGLIGECTSENVKLAMNVVHPLVVVGGGVGAIENYKNPQQIVANATASDQSGNHKWGRRNLKQLRSSSSSLPWMMMDPRRIVFFFATLSSMGTIILIYFTLSMGKLNGASAAAGLD